MSCSSDDVVPWDASLIDRLDELRLDASGPIDGFVEPVLASLRSYGLAVLHSLAGDGTTALGDRLGQLGSGLGRIVVQSPRGELIEDVRDVSDLEERDDRGYRSGGELAPHSDPPTLIVLHCIAAARSGGESHLVNVPAIFDRLAVDDPQALITLQKHLPMWRVDGMGGRAAGPGDPIPVLAERNGVVSCVLYRPFIEQAAEALGTPLTDEQTAALDAFDRHSNDPSLALRFTLAPGETLVLHNRAVLHARTDFEDWPELERRRHLKRLWIDAPEALPVNSVHELGDIFSNA